MTDEEIKMTKTEKARLKMYRKMGLNFSVVKEEKK